MKFLDFILVTGRNWFHANELVSDTAAVNLDDELVDTVRYKVQ